MAKKRAKSMLSSYSIIMLLIIGLGILSHLLPNATFVGEETGGAYNGTVAAQMPLVQLPNSKVNLKIGLALVSASGKTDIEGRGIFPDKEIIPTIEDRKNKIDPELNWILDDIRRDKEVEELLKGKEPSKE